MRSFQIAQKESSMYHSMNHFTIPWYNNRNLNKRGALLDASFYQAISTNFSLSAGVSSSSNFFRIL